MKQSAPALPPESIGVGLKPAHYRDALALPGARERAGPSGGAIQFFEVHAENYMCAGGPAHAWLGAVRERFPLSMHGVCLSLGGYDDLDKEHLKRLRAVVERYEPALVSEHLAWSAHDAVFYHDLIAPPLTEAALRRTADHIDQTQDALGRMILVENPSRYLAAQAEMDEPEFLNALARRTGCGLLLDINNVYVSAGNLGFDAEGYLGAIDADAVGEIHLAGHAVDEARGFALRIDDHGSPVCGEVLALYQRFITRAGARPTLIEWDTDTPSLPVLAEEAVKAQAAMRAGLDANLCPAGAHAHA